MSITFLDESNIKQGLGDDERSVISQKAMTDILSEFTTSEKAHLSSTGDQTDRTSEIIGMLTDYGVCYLDSGEFYVTQINMPESSSIIGCGEGSVLVQIARTDETGERAVINLGNHCLISNVNILGQLRTRPAEIEINNPDYAIKLDIEGDVAQTCKIENTTIRGFSGAGIYVYDTGYGPLRSVLVSNVEIKNCGAGIYTGYHGEYGCYSNVICVDNYIGCYNNGGSNKFVGCGFDRNCYGLYMTSGDVSSPNNGHGTCTGCTFNHNVYSAIYAHTVVHGFVIDSCQMFHNGSAEYPSIHLLNSNGIVISDTEMSGNIKYPIIVKVEAIEGKYQNNTAILTSCLFHYLPQVHVGDKCTFQIDRCYMLDGTSITGENLKTVHGNIIALQNFESNKYEFTCSNSTLEDLSTETITMCGKNLLKNIALDKTSQGITFTKSNTGVAVVGTATANSFYFPNEDLYLPAGNYHLSGCPNGGSSSAYYLSVSKVENGEVSLIGRDFGDGLDFTVPEGVTLKVFIAVVAGQTINLNFTPMIELASVATGEFEAYRETTCSISSTGEISNTEFYSPISVFYGTGVNTVITMTYLQNMADIDEKIESALTQAKESGKFDGYTPQKGVDYWTKADKKEIVDDVVAKVPFVKTAEQPTFVNSVDEMTDTSKVYVMPNGNIWAYAKGIVENKVNQYKSDTAQFNVRWNNGATGTMRGNVMVEVDGLDFTDKSSYIVRFEGVTLVRHTNMGVHGQVSFFNGNEFLSSKWIYSTANSNAIAYTQDDTGYYVDLMDASPSATANKCYFAICLADNVAIDATNCENLFIEFVPLTTYTEEYAWRDTGISYVQYIPTDNDFNNIAEKVNKKINATIYVDGESGDDTKAGSQDSPLKTIQKAIDSGAKTIYCKAGTYNENINLNNVHGVNIIGQWESYESGKRPKVRIDHSTTLTPIDDGSGLKTVALSADLYKYEHPLLYQVFVTKTLQPTIGSGLTIIYVVSLWNVTDEEISSHYKLVPVMTLEECQSTEETFFYDGTTIYIHSTGSTFRMVSSTKRNKVENCSDIVFEDIAFDYSYYDALTVNNSNGVVFRNCEFSHSSRSHGLATVNMNGELYNCEAYRNCFDGLNFHDFGETTVYNCIGAYNYDDGISHHDGCTGSIHGGQYHHNGKGGVSSPTYGAVIDVYNAVMHDNQYGIYAVGGTADRQIIVNGCYIHNNTYGIVSPQYELLVIHSTLIDNSTNTSGNVTVIGNT